MFLISLTLCFISLGLCISNHEILSYMKKNGSWIFYEEREDIKIYIYEKKELPIIKIERKLNLDITRDEIFKTILDIENYNNMFTDKSLYSEFLTSVSDTVFVYQKTKNYIPFIRNRHLIFKLYQVDENILQWVIVNKDNRLYRLKTIFVLKLGPI